MKYCVSARQPNSILKKADEIKVAFQDINGIENFIEDELNKTVIYEIPFNKREDEIEWLKLYSYAEKIDLKLALGNLKLVDKCKEYGLKYYWGFPISTYYELEGVLQLGVCELFLGVPLTFDLENCKKYNLPIRVVANVAYDNYITRKNGIQGFYIRPEDIKLYDEYIDCIEFITSELSKEATLLKIYKEDGFWPGNLNLLLVNLNFNIDNRVLPDEFGKIRINCQQKCMRNNRCHFCESAFNFADNIRKEALDRKKKNNN